MPILRRALAPCVLILSWAAPAQNQPGFSYQRLTDGVLNRACDMAFAPDGRLFVCERLTGNIKVLKDGALQPGNWATIPTVGQFNMDTGLMGICIDPGFLTNRYVYVLYTEATGAETVIARLQEVGGVGTNLTRMTPPGALPSGGHHNGGTMLFDYDGRLFVATGDRWTPATAQDPASWNGKILRFGMPGFTIPIDNPFPGSPVWSLGHRNTYGMALHPETGDLFQCENGDIRWDELNRIVPGGNYGWPIYEGPMNPINPAYVQPLAWYGNRTPDPTGMCFYTGSNYPAAYRNNWFWSEYDSGKVHRVVLDATQQAIASDNIFWQLPAAATDTAMGPDGNVWVLFNESFGQRGSDEVGRFLYQSAPSPGLNLTAMCNKTVGGAITFCCHGRNGDLFFPWVAAWSFASPVTTPWGAQWVPADIVLPLQIVVADDRSYLGVAIPDSPHLVGTPVHTQAARVDPSTLQISLTNPAYLLLR